MLELTDKMSNYIADRINNLHLLLCFYSSVGWMSTYHSQILVFLLPSMMFNWLIDDENCWMTRLENKFRVNNSDKNVGFIHTKIDEYGFELTDTDVKKLVNVCTYIFFLLSYNSYLNMF
jgi:hypothetical protein